MSIEFFRLRRALRSPFLGVRVPRTFGAVSGVHACVYVYLAWRHYCLLFSCVSGESNHSVFVRPNPLGML